MSIWQIIMCIVWGIVLFWLSGISAWRSPDRPAWLLRTIFTIKIVMATAFFALYTFYYTDRSTADMYKYYDDAKVLYTTLLQEPNSCVNIIQGKPLTATDSIYYNQMNHWQLGYSRLFENNHRPMILFNFLLMPLSGQSILVHCFIMCFLSFLGLIFMHDFLKHYVPEKSRLILLSLVILPGPLFWTSSLLKESLVVLCIGLILKIWLWRPGVFKYLVVCIPIILLAQLKTYFVLAFGLPVFYKILDIGFGKRRRMLWLVLGFTLVVLVLGSSFLPEAYNPWSSLTQKLHGFREVNAANPAASSYDLKLSDSPDMVEWLSKLPIALYTGICRPMLWEARSPVVGLSALDFLFWMAGLVFVWISRRRTKPKENLLDSERELSIYIILYTLPLFLLFGLLSGNFGNLVRYRAPIYLFWNVLPVVWLHRQYASVVEEKLKSLVLRIEGLLSGQS